MITLLTRFAFFPLFAALISTTLSAVPFPRAALAAPPPDGPDWVHVSAGEFQMGCVPIDRECAENENPRHRVVLSRDFWIMRTEVTVGTYRSYTQATGRPFPLQPSGSAENHPVVEVTWSDSAAFCGWVGGRLPTEAEWEFSARGGQDGWVFPWGNLYEKGRASDSDDFRHPGTMPVRSFAPNALGLFDVAGNVWEWVGDWYAADYYLHAKAIDPTGPQSGEARVARGGGWRPFPRLMRVSNRGRYAPDTHSAYVGIRCVRDAAP